MKKTIDEIEESQVGVALAADDSATPYDLNELSEILGDIRLLVSQYCIRPTRKKQTKVMFVSSLTIMIKCANDQLAFYDEDLKQSKIVEAFCISSGLYRDDEFWDLIDRICEEMKGEEVYQSLLENRNQLQSLLADAENAMRNCNPIVFEKFFFRKKLDYNDSGVMKRFNLWLYENQPPCVDKLRELRAQAVAKALEMGVFDFAPSPSQKEMEEVRLEIMKELLPYGYKVTEEFKVAYAKFYRFARKSDLMVRMDYKRYGHYILNHFYEFSREQLYAIFELDMMLFLINQEMDRFKPEMAKDLDSTVNEQPDSNQTEATEELFHFIHPSVDDEEGWKIHNEVKRLVRRMSIPDIIKYLKKLNSENIILLPIVSTVAYDELVRMGMPNTGGFSKEHFRKQYHL